MNTTFSTNDWTDLLINEGDAMSEAQEIAMIMAEVGYKE